MSSHPAEEAGRGVKIGTEHGGISENGVLAMRNGLQTRAMGGNRKNDPQNSM
jgi:hypothetical protein